MKEAGQGLGNHETRIFNLVFGIRKHISYEDSFSLMNGEINHFIKIEDLE
jgi:hypothetical protein